MQRWIGYGLLGVALAGASACGLIGSDDGPQPLGVSAPTIGQVVGTLPELTLHETAAEQPTRDDVLAAYNQVYGQLAQPHDNLAVGKRIADLQMQIGEERDMAGEAQPYQQAINLYESLLDEAAATAQADEILYQLARAHDLAGRQPQARDYLHRLIRQYPDSEYIAEARFRRGEIRFSAGEYELAADDYAFVSALGDATPYYRNASYMLGWAHFKLARFEQGLPHFFDVIDHLTQDSTEPQAELDRSGAELLNDTFRVVTLAVAYLDGAASLAEQMRLRGKPHWQFLAYQRLAQDYFDKERFLDSVQTWQVFIEHNPLDARAPGAHIGMIDTLREAGFPGDILPKKREFVLRYGVYSPFWSHHPAEVRQDYLPTSA